MKATKWHDEKGRPTEEWLKAAETHDGGAFEGITRGFWVGGGCEVNTYLQGDGTVRRIAYWWKTKEDAQQSLDAARWNYGQRTKTEATKAKREESERMASELLERVTNDESHEERSKRQKEFEEDLLVACERMAADAHSDPKAAAGSLKAPLHLVPPVFEEAVARVLADGAAKYGEWNWRAGGAELHTMTYVAAMRRHISAYLDGETLDPQSGLPHIAHVAASVAILLDAEGHGTLTDNRPNPCDS